MRAKSTLKIFYATLAAATLGVTAGCATTGDLDKLRNELNEVRTATQRAQSDATAAGKSAQDAQSAADSASSTANDALRIAEEGNSCCKRNTRRMDRMFQESVLK